MFLSQFKKSRESLNIIIIIIILFSPIGQKNIDTFPNCQLLKTLIYSTVPAKCFQ